MGREGSDDKLREVLRQLPAEFSNMSIMSTLGIVPPGPCHFPPEGYVEVAEAILPLVQQHNYGRKPENSITPPNLVSASYTSGEKDEIALVFDQPMGWFDESANELYLDGQRGKVASGKCDGNTIKLTLTEPSSAKTIKYVDGGSWKQERVIRGKNGIAALTFCDVPINYGIKDDPTRILRKPIPAKVVVLTFDDGCASHATYVGPLLQQLGFKGSFFISEFADVKNNKGEITGGFGNKNMYMTWPQIKSLHDLGMDVGNHGYRHVWADLSANAWMEECVPIEDRCIAAGIPQPVTFCWPVYQVSPRAFPTLANHGYTFCRGGGGCAYDPLQHNPYNVPSFSISDSDIKKNKDVFYEAVKKAVPGGMVVLTYHGVPDVEHPGVGTEPQVFAEQMKYLKDHNYKVISLRDMDEYVNPVRAMELRSR
jgi:peptidoglycan/xylan/chitin deacetylase (PgdA/CDA1 family)